MVIGFKIIRVVSITYILSLISIYLFQDRLLFFPRDINNKTEIEFSDYEITFNHLDTKLSGWLLKEETSSKSPLIIYYGGNAEEVSRNIYNRQRFGSVSLLLMNYRGYGKSEGEPNERDLFSDALYIFDKITKDLNLSAHQIILMGRSLGSGIATYVASKRVVKGVILVTPFDSIEAVAIERFPFFPVKFLLKNKFLSIQYVSSFKTPLLCLMAEKDRIVPVKHGKKLAEAWGGPKKSVIISGANHNSIPLNSQYWDEIKLFIEDLKAESI